MDRKGVDDLFRKARENVKKFQLKDGRYLSYCEAGKLQGGLPVLFQFGIMSSSLTVVMFEEAAKRRATKPIQNSYRLYSGDDLNDLQTFSLHSACPGLF